MFLTIEEIECLIEKREEEQATEVSKIAALSCITTTSNFCTIENIKNMQLLYTVKNLLYKKIDNDTYQCLANKLRK